MWILTYAIYGLLVVSGWILAIAAGISALAMFLLYAKGTSVGVTRSEHLVCAAALVAALVLGFASIVLFAGATAFATSHDRRMISLAEARRADCAAIGNRQPLPAPAKIVILSRRTQERSLANQLLDRRLQAWRFQPAWGVLVSGDVREQPSPGGPVRMIDVQVLALPSGEALGQFPLRVADRETPISLDKPIPTEEQTIANWLNGLPGRPRGDVELLAAPAPPLDEVMRELKRLEAVIEMNMRGEDLVVTAVNFVADKATDRDLELLIAFPRIEAVRLPECPITDAGLLKLAKLLHLRELDLRGTRATRSGILELQQLNPGIQLIIADTASEE